MKKVFPLILFMIFFVLKNQLYGQDRTLYNIPDIQQSTLLNPAIQHECKWFIGLPVLSNILANINHSSFTYNDVFQEEGSNYSIDFDNIEKKVKNWNYLKSQVQLNILSIGYKHSDKYYFSFDIINKTEFKLGYPDDYIKVRHGNAQFENGKNTLQFMPYLNAVNYNEISFGASKKIDSRFTLGAKIKYLSGVANAKLTNSKLKLTTDAETFDLSIEGDIEANTSFPMTVSYDTLNLPENVELNDINITKDFIFNKNRGLAIDFGIIYNLSDKITLSGSIVDLGFIRWKSNINAMSGKGSFEFTGVDISEWTGNGDFNVNTDSIWDVIQDTYIDSLQNAYNLSNNNSPYTSFLNPKLYLGATYKINDKLNVGALSRSSFYNKRFYTSLTFSLNSNPFKNFNASLSYSIMNYSFNNIGFGLSYKFGPIQFYLLSDSFLAAFNPKKYRSLSLQLGFNLILGCHKCKNEKKEKAGKPCPAYR